MYTLTTDEYDKCVKFAKDIDVGHYSWRDNQDDEEYKRRQQLICKGGELCVYHYLTNNNLLKHSNVSYPDFNIYLPGQKNYDPDIITDRNRVHVKSQDKNTPMRFKDSWICQKSDKHLFESSQINDAMAFTSVDLSKEQDGIVSVEVRAIIPVVLIHRNKLFKLPVNEFSNKLAIYLSDIVGLFPNKLYWM